MHAHGTHADQSTQARARHISFTFHKHGFVHTASRGSTALELSQILLHHLVRRPHGERQCERIRYPLHRNVLLEQPGLKITHEVVKVLQPSHGEGALPLMLLRVFRSRGRPCNKRCSLTAVLSFSHQLYAYVRAYGVLLMAVPGTVSGCMCIARLLSRHIHAHGRF